jgi:acyl carrier protein
VKAMSADLKFDLIFRKIMNLKAEQPIDDIRRESFPAWDSLRHAELLIAIQVEFGLKIGFNEVLSLNSVKACRDKIQGSQD